MSGKANPEIAAGQNVFAKIDGKEVGPIYLVQIADGKATLQGKDQFIIPVEDLIRTAD